MNIAEIVVVAALSAGLVCVGAGLAFRLEQRRADARVRRERQRRNRAILWSQRRPAMKNPWEDALPHEE